VIPGRLQPRRHEPPRGRRSLSLRRLTPAHTPPRNAQRTTARKERVTSPLTAGRGQPSGLSALDAAAWQRRPMRAVEGWAAKRGGGGGCPTGATALPRDGVSDQRSRAVGSCLTRKFRTTSLRELQAKIAHGQGRPLEAVATFLDSGRASRCLRGRQPDAGDQLESWSLVAGPPSDMQRSDRHLPSPTASRVYRISVSVGSVLRFRYTMMVSSGAKVGGSR
jgi:hypothetical protein